MYFFNLGTEKLCIKYGKHLNMDNEATYNPSDSEAAETDQEYDNLSLKSKLL